MDPLKLLIGFGVLLPAALIFTFFPVNADEDIYIPRRREMVERQIKARGISNPGVIGAMLKVERHLFVPGYLAASAYADSPLPIGSGQTISQPYIVAYMTEALELGSSDRVLEIGTGSAYQAAVLAEIVKEVYSIEIVKELAELAEERMTRLGYGNVYLRHGDGYKGWREKAPFDAIMVTAAPPELPMELVDQLSVGGRMIVPVGEFFQELQLITMTESGHSVKRLIPVRFVPMVRGLGKEG